MKKVAIILSGCGYLDGSEIRESVLALLALEMREVAYDIFAPDIEQFHVMNHLEAAPSESQARHVMEEAARIARGEVEPLSTLNAADYDGLVIPGGFGVAKNLSDFAFKGAGGKVIEDLRITIESFHQSSKPIAAICIAPALLALTLGDKRPALTVGEADETAQELGQTGAVHQVCATHDCVVDSANKLVSTPAYMSGNAKLRDVHTGINKAIDALVNLAV